MKKIWWITTNATEKIWWNNIWYLCQDMNFVIDGTKWDFFRAKDDCHCGIAITIMVNFFLTINALFCVSDLN